MANALKGGLTKGQYDEACGYAAHNATIKVFGSLEKAKEWADKPQPPVKYFNVNNANEQQRRRLIMCGIIDEHKDKRAVKKMQAMGVAAFW